MGGMEEEEHPGTRGTGRGISIERFEYHIITNK